MEKTLSYLIQGGDFAQDLHKKLQEGGYDSYIAKYQSDRYFMLDDSKRMPDGSYPINAYIEITEMQSYKAQNYMVAFKAVESPVTDETISKESELNVNIANTPCENYSVPSDIIQTANEQSKTSEENLENDLELKISELLNECAILDAENLELKKLIEDTQNSVNKFAETLRNPLEIKNYYEKVLGEKISICISSKD